MSRGSAGAVADAVSLALFMRSVGLRGGIADKALTATPTYDVSVQRILEWDEHFECAASRCVAAKGPLTARDFRSDVVTLRVTQRTLDARDFGAQQECTQRGLLIATFDAASGTRVRNWNARTGTFAMLVSKRSRCVEGGHTSHTLGRRREGSVTHFEDRTRVCVCARLEYMRLCVRAGNTSPKSALLNSVLQKPIRRTRF